MPDQDEDGLGQSALDDLVWHWRFWRSRRSDIPWRAPTPGDQRWVDASSRIARFGDFTLAVADYGGKRWVIRERIWSGWPDPPTYAIFVFEGDGIWMARDFEHWPRAWRKPWREDEHGGRRPDGTTHA